MAVVLPARAAAIRGDDFQHAVGWCWVSRALTDPAIHSVSIEDAGGGSFDDLVVRRRWGKDSFWQIKTSNYGSKIVDEPWLVSHVTGGRSPLRHFFDTWQVLRSGGNAFELVLLTNRSYDPHHSLLGALRDLKTEQIDTRRLMAAGTTSKIGQARARWIEHLETDLDTLVAFLSAVCWKASAAESDWDEKAKTYMLLAGLRYDETAVTVGKALVRTWVTTGAGPQTIEMIRQQVEEKNLVELAPRSLAARFTTYTDVAATSRTAEPINTTPKSELRAVWNGHDGSGPGWKPLWANVAPPEYRIMLNAHDGYVRGVDLHPLDGEMLALTGGNDGSMCLWNVSTGVQRWRVQAHDGHITGLRFLEVGDLLTAISAGADAVVRVWDVREKRHLAEFSGHTIDPIRITTGTVEGRPVVVSADAWGDVWAWNPVGGGALQNFVLPADDDAEKDDRSARRISAVGFGQFDDEPAIVAVTGNGRLACWRYADAALIATARYSIAASYISAATSCGSGPVTALVGDAGYPWELWRPSAGAVGIQPTPIRRPEAMSVHSTPDSTLAVLVRGDLEVWDLATRAVIRRAKYSSAYSTESALVRTADGYLAAVGANDGRVRIYDLSDAVPFPFAGVEPNRSITAVAICITAAGRTVAVAGHHTSMLTIDTGDQLWQWSNSGEWIRNVAVGTVGDLPVIVAGDDRGFMTVRRADRDQTVATWITGHGWPLGLSVGRLGDQDIAVTGGQGTDVHLRDLASGDSLGQFTVDVASQVVDLHLLKVKGRILLIVAGNGWNKSIWDLERREQIATIDRDVAFGPVAVARRLAGDRLVGIGHDGELCYIDLFDGSATPVGEACRVNNDSGEGNLRVTASPFGDLAVFASDDGILTTWNLGTAAAVNSIRFDQPIQSIDTTWDERDHRLLAVVGLPNGSASVSFAIGE
jgi:WD40 repeat protein